MEQALLEFLPNDIVSYIILPYCEINIAWYAKEIKTQHMIHDLISGEAEDLREELADNYYRPELDPYETSFCKFFVSFYFRMMKRRLEGIREFQEVKKLILQKRLKGFVSTKTYRCLTK